MNSGTSTDGAARDDCRIGEIERRLRTAYGQPRHFNPEDPLDDLIFLVLSRMTQEIKYVRTYSRLRSSLSTWHAVRDAPCDELEILIHEAGLAPTKAAQIQAILREIESREAGLRLDRLREMESDQVEAYLTSLPGVARKDRAVRPCFTPSDETFYLWIPTSGVSPSGSVSLRRANGAKGEDAPSRLRSRESCGGSLHVTMVAHGRQVCRARAPMCESCALADLCPTAGSNPQAARPPPRSRPG